MRLYINFQRLTKAFRNIINIVSARKIKDRGMLKINNINNIKSIKHHKHQEQRAIVLHKTYVTPCRKRASFFDST